MNNMKAGSLSELKEREAGAIDELLQLKIKKSVGQLKQSHLIGLKRKEIARIKTSLKVVGKQKEGDPLLKTNQAGK
jgi:ribosomal protein L29